MGVKKIVREKERYRMRRILIRYMKKNMERDMHVTRDIWNERVIHRIREKE